MEYSFTDEYFKVLRSYLTADELTVFEGFFRKDETTGYHVCERYDDYIYWVKTTIDDDPNSPFLAWDGYVNGKSQGSDGN